MLVLTRKFGEEIVINGNIVVKLIKPARGGIQIGIDAPAEVEIVRRELIEEEKEG